MKAEVQEKEKEKTQQEAMVLCESANALVISDAETFQNADVLLVKVKGVRKQIKKIYRPILDGINKLKKDTMAEMDKYDLPLESAEDKLKSSMVKYHEAEEAIKRKQEAELQEAARKKAEDDRLRQAKKLEDMGQQAAAEALLEKPIAVPVVSLQKESDNLPAGMSMVDNWKAEVVDLMALVKAVANMEQPLTLLEANEVVLNQMAKALKDAMNVPGVVAKKEMVVRRRV